MRLIRYSKAHSPHTGTETVGCNEVCCKNKAQPIESKIVNENIAVCGYDELMAFNACFVFYNACDACEAFLLRSKGHSKHNVDLYISMLFL